MKFDQIPFARLIDYVRKECGDHDLTVIVGQDDRDETIFAEAKGVRITEKFSTICDFLFWSVAFIRIATRLRMAIAEQEVVDA